MSMTCGSRPYAPLSLPSFQLILLRSRFVAKKIARLLSPDIKSPRTPVSAPVSATAAGGATAISAAGATSSTTSTAPVYSNLIISTGHASAASSISSEYSALNSVYSRQTGVSVETAVLSDICFNVTCVIGYLNSGKMSCASHVIQSSSIHTLDCWHEFTHRSRRAIYGTRM